MRIHCSRCLKGPALGMGLAAALALTACTTDSGTGSLAEEAGTVASPAESLSEPKPEAPAMAAGEMAHSEETMASGRAPNNGATIRILSPTDGATFAVGDPIPVRIAVENFDLATGGNHWHLEVDGVEVAMAMGGTTTATLRGLAPGARRIEAVLANGQHQDLENGFTIHVTVGE